MKKRGTRFFQPESIIELKEMIEKEPESQLLAGGSSMFREINGDHLVKPGAILMLDSILELQKESRSERYLEYGSMLTIQQIIESSKRYLPAILLDGLVSLAPYPVRNISTIGGAIANRNFITDITSILLLLNTKVEVINLENRKQKTKWETITQYQSKLKERGHHLITRIRIPQQQPSYSYYYKSGHPFNLFSEISFSAIAELEKESLSSISMVFNIENRNIVRTRNIDAELIGKHLPVSHRNRDSFLKTLYTNLDRYGELKDNQKYRMAQIIMHFLETF